ncbi:MAG: nitroreductase family deazaflavin-dependent oxidoreductase [Anaerolineales bacterium]
MNTKQRSIDRVNGLEKYATEQYCYLTTTGRVTGNPHEIEIWFGLNDHTLYLLSEGRDRSDWVKNLLKTPAVTIRIMRRKFKGTARLVSDGKEEMMARRMLATKYEQWRVGQSFSRWARTALVVGIDLDILTK